ncbi:MAG: hypothetical protein V1936_05020 [Patescibacteria group bacterium]
MSELDKIPQSIPEAQAKKALLEKGGVPHVYLGQGLIFVPPESAMADYNEYLLSQGINPGDFPLDLLMRAGPGGAVFNSVRAEQVWKEMQKNQIGASGVRKPEAFQSTIYDGVSGKTVENLFGVDGGSIATMQANDLQDGLRRIRSIIAHLGKGYISRVILPKQYKYSGHTDFVNDAKLVGGDIAVTEIPEIQEDGSQDLQTMRTEFEKIKSEGRVAILIDQEMNNNASGWDRDPKLNEELASLLKEFEGTIFYVGDIAYKGLKEDVLEQYPLMQKLIEKGVPAFFYFSPTKLTFYRKPPSFKSIVFATPGGFADTKKLKDAFQGCQRAPGGIGCTDNGAILMEKLSSDPEFLKEVRTLRLYLKYILASLGSNTNGIFRCREPQVIQTLNSGSPQAVTVGQRENIWPLGDPKLRALYQQALKINA